MAVDHLSTPDTAGYYSAEIAGTRHRSTRYWAASIISVAAYAGAMAWILSSSTAKVYGFPVSHDLRTLIEIVLQIAPMIAAFFMVLLLPVKDRVIEHLANPATPARRLAMTVAASALTAIVTFCATGAAVLAVYGFQPGALSPLTILWVAAELIFDLTLISVFTTILYSLTRRRLWAALLLFVSYIVVVMSAGPKWGITSYIGFGSSVPVMLTTYSTAPLYDAAGWLFRIYWTCITLLMLSLFYAFLTRSRRIWYLCLGLSVLCIAAGSVLVKLQSRGIAKYQAPSQSALAAVLQKDTETARLQLAHFDVRMDYRPDEEQVAVEGLLTFRNGSRPARTVYFQMPALMVPDQLQIQGAGDYQLVPFGKYVQVEFSNALPPFREAKIAYRGSIRPAGPFDLAVQQKVLSGAFFLTDADVLISARTPACLASTSMCGNAENYLMSDRATGRIAVLAPESFRVSSPGEQSGHKLGDARFEHIFTIASPRLATFLVACAPFRESVVVGGNGVMIRVLRSPAAVADGNLEAPLAAKILSFYESAWPAYQRRGLNIVEIPTPLGEAMAYDGTISLSDKIVASRNPASGTASSLLEFVMAHEIAHQWWGFGVVPARTPGRLFVTESIAQFAAYKFLDHRGILSEQTAQRDEERRYKAGRARLGEREAPLARAEAVDEVAYNKGPFALLSLDQLDGGSMMSRLGALANTYSHESHGRTSPEQFVATLIAELPDANRETARRFFYEVGESNGQN